MYIKNGIAYAGEASQPLKVCAVRPLANYILWIKFSNGECKIFDFKERLETPAFAPLKDKTVFQSVYLDHGVTVWNNGDIDIAPEYLFEKGFPIDLT